MKVTKEFMERENKRYGVDLGYYAMLRTTWARKHYMNDMVDSETITHVNNILDEFGWVEPWTNTREIAMRLDFLDYMKETTPFIYLNFEMPSDLTKDDVSITSVSLFLHLMLASRLQDYGVLASWDKLTKQMVHNIATVGFTYDEKDRLSYTDLYPHYSFRMR